MADHKAPPELGASTRSNPDFPMPYYGLLVAATALALLAVYNLIVGNWCARHGRPLPSTAALFRPRNSLLRRPGVCSFRYERKAEGGAVADHRGCAICLSAFEEGEEVWELPRCGHEYHAPCIDIWLHSHPDCPLCRTSVADPRQLPLLRRENYRPSLIASGGFF